MEKPSKSMGTIDLVGKIVEISHSNLEISPRLVSILNIISQDMGFDDALVYSLDKDKRLTCRYTNQKSALFRILSQYRCHVGEGIIGTVAQKRTSQYYTIWNISPRFGCLFFAELDDLIERYKGFAFLPLSDDSYIYGVLVLASSSREGLQDGEKLILSILSREIGGILRSFGLIVSSKKRISELAMLSELGKVLISNVESYELLKNMTLIIAKSLDAVFVSIKLEYSLLKMDPQRYTYGIIDSSVKDHVERLEQSAIRFHQPASLRSPTVGQIDPPLKFALFSAPLASKNRILGTITICAERSAQPHPLEEDGQNIINTIANYISSGLENTLLNTRLKDVVRELTEAQKRLIEQEKFRSLGEMTANIAHEIKNPLVIIGGFTKRLAKRMRDEQADNKYVDIILKEVARLESILNEILSYVKENPVTEETCGINEFLEEIIYLLSTDTSWENVQITKDFDRTLPPVPCDSHQLKQVFINILMNAYEAMHARGRISITTRRVLDKNRPFVSVMISDTGGGINPEIIENIFNPFFTTKEKGTGLGLAISHKIISNHRGHIDIENIAGKGATFIVYLPLTNTTKEEFL